MSKISGTVRKFVVVLIAAFVIVCGIGIYLAMNSYGHEGKPIVVSQAEVYKRPAVVVDSPSAVEPGAETATDAVEAETVVGASDSEVQEGTAPLLATQSGSDPPSPSVPAPSNGGGTGPAPSGSPAPFVPSGPSISRTWHEPVYTTVHHDAIYQSVHHDGEYITHTKYYSVCSQCGYKVQGSIYSHQDATGHTGFASDVPVSEQVLVRAAFDEQVLVQAAFDEQVLVTEGYWS